MKYSYNKQPKRRITLELDPILCDQVEEAADREAISRTVYIRNALNAAVSSLPMRRRVQPSL